MKNLSRPALFFCLLLQTGCEVLETPVTTGSYWQTTQEGAKVWWHAPEHPSKTISWSGGKDSEGQAHGFGKLVTVMPRIPSGLLTGGWYGDTRTHEGLMAHGKMEGSVYRHSSYDNSVWKQIYAGGEYQSSTLAKLGVYANQSSSESSNDNLLVGAMLAGGGLASGETALVGAGVSAMQGDTSGMLNQISQAGGTNSSGSTVPNGALMGGGPARMDQMKREPNLVDRSYLRDYRHKGNDHIVNYIKAADAAYESYTKGGDTRYYDQHKEYVELAKSFHERTGTETQGFAR